MKYTKYSPEENLKLGRIWGRGHTGMPCLPSDTRAERSKG